MLLLGLSMNAEAQYGSYYQRLEVDGAEHQETEFIIHAGVSQSSFRYDHSTAVNVGIDYTPYEADGVFSYSFITNFAYADNYWSINPLGASAIAMTMFCKNIIEDNPTAETILMIMAGESMSVNFKSANHFEVSPYWNLLRLSNWNKGATYVTGSLGLRANYYFGSQDRWSIRVRGEYSWGYGNADWWGEKIYNIFGDSGEWTNYEKYNKPHTPFKGWSYGLSIGYRL